MGLPRSLSQFLPLVPGYLTRVDRPEWCKNRLTRVLFRSAERREKKKLAASRPCSAQRSAISCEITVLPDPSAPRILTTFFHLPGCLIHVMISWMTCSRAAEGAISNKFGRSGLAISNESLGKPIEIAAKQSMRGDVRINSPSLGVDELVIELCVKLPPEMRTLFASSNMQTNGWTVLRKNVDQVRVSARASEDPLTTKTKA